MDTVYLTDHAFRDIVLETAEHPTIETGGILLGAASEGDWFVVEVLDPGPRTVRSATYFEYNHTYATHLANKVARRYASPLRLLGLWHRHPGSLDTFSSTDDETHVEYLRLLRGAFVSMLVNIDPDFRTTFYRVEAGLRWPRYARLSFAVGDRHFPPALLAQGVARRGGEFTSGELPRSATDPPADRTAPRAPSPPPMRIEYLPTASPQPVQQGWLEQIGCAVNGLINPLEELAQANTYRPFRGEEQAPPPRRASAEQKSLLDMLETEFDYLDERGDTFQYHVSPQEPGFRLLVGLTSAEIRTPYPRRVEFAFYYRQGVPVVAIEGREQPYHPGCVRRYYAQYDPPTVLPIEPPAQEPRHEGPPTYRSGS